MLSAFISLIILNFVISTEIDNKVAAPPKIECDDQMMVLSVSTTNPFSGRLYVKGEYANPDCVSNYVANPSTHGAQITVPYNKCNVKRLRMSSQGLQYATIIVVSFHSTFETKVDRAYKINCMFQQVNNTFTVPSIEVSMLPTTELSQTVGNIQCMYEVRRGSVDGPQVRYAIIGEPVYHVWKCESTNMRMLVRDCFVDDGQGNRVVTLDSSGCSTDKYVLQTPTYMGPDYNMVWTESHVFKYADKPQVVFQCQIHMCDTNDKQCQSITPPTCNGQVASTAGPTSGISGPSGTQGPDGTNFTLHQPTIAGHLSMNVSENTRLPTHPNITLLPSIDSNYSTESTNYEFQTVSAGEINNISTSRLFNESEYENVTGSPRFSIHPLNLRNFSGPSENRNESEENMSNIDEISNTTGGTKLSNETNLSNVTAKTIFGFPTTTEHTSSQMKLSGSELAGFGNVSRHSLDNRTFSPEEPANPSHTVPNGYASFPLPNLPSASPPSSNNTPPIVDLFQQSDSTLLAKVVAVRRNKPDNKKFRRSLKEESKHVDRFVWDVLSNEITVMELDDDKSRLERKSKETSVPSSSMSEEETTTLENRKKPICIPAYSFAITVGISAFSILLSMAISVIVCSFKHKKF